MWSTKPETQRFREGHKFINILNGNENIYSNIVFFFKMKVCTRPIGHGLTPLNREE